MHILDLQRKYRGKSTLALRPRETEQISAILQYCNERRLAVVPQVQVLPFHDLSGILKLWAGWQHRPRWRERADTRRDYLVNVPPKPCYQFRSCRRDPYLRGRFAWPTPCPARNSSSECRGSMLQRYDVHHPSALHQAACWSTWTHTSLSAASPCRSTWAPRAAASWAATSPPTPAACACCATAACTAPSSASR
jgi:hypothetical protein